MVPHSPDRITKSLLFAGILAALPALTALADPPPTDKAPTHRNDYNNPYPALPNWGGSTGAGTDIKDPAFGCPILRVTDWNTGRVAGRPLFTPSSSEERNWNTTSTYFHITDSGGNYIGFQFNPTTVTATRIPGYIAVTALNDFDATRMPTSATA